ncbi:hypothetical protein [Staphylococcus auricularis]|uniref:hypothetical protein n=1 Tax=Staphylococcus auricularis TaxID=29379 RepID=UPI00242DF290|nr:hypothetical protein [Staphylococcus auricularis]
MTREVSFRYLVDKSGDEYLPMTHIDAVIGLSEIIELQNDKIERLEKEIQTLKGGQK